MHDQVAELAKRGRKLTPEDRSRLVDLLLASLHEGTVAQVEAAWDEEAERRLDACDRGEMQGVDGEEVLARPPPCQAMNLRFLPPAELLEAIPHQASIPCGPWHPSKHRARGDP